LTAVKIQIVVFWVVTPRSVVVGYHRFGWLCCLHLQGGVTGDGENIRNAGQRMKGKAEEAYRCIFV